jgi:hypothetical protein
METTMTKALSIAAAAAALTFLAACTPAFAEHPTFQLGGLPITSHQAALIGSANVEEMVPVPLALASRAASAHQAQVLTPRQRIAEQRFAAATAHLPLPRPRPAR